MVRPQTRDPRGEPAIVIRRVLLCHVLGLAVALGLIVAGCTIEARDADAPGPGAPDYTRGTHVVLLGTGTPNADPERSGPAVAVVVNGVSYLVDAGPGIVRRAAAAAAKGISALEPRRLERVFLTHLHSDHTVGLPDLMLTPWVLERDRPLDVFGPTGTEQMVTHLLAAYDADVRRRIDGLQPQNATGWRAVAHVVTPGVVFQDTNVTVIAIAVQHEDWPEAFAYRFETADRAIVISGDTRPTEAIVAACQGCDVLVHEVYSDAGFARRAPAWQRYHERAHTSASALAGLAARARPRVLVLYHQLLWGTTPDQLVGEVRSGYDGVVVYGNDLDVF
jgi:ribonuclease BN (tRNA processing enzyme)